ncbi:hypothetical protein E4U09_002521 [Claviceps aff. purpurea]|uniref:Uncharacterized protein n=1 Tax=Claviceps aff. purpurea TaxID=1967640 RepID=A0A9P7TYN4_9HYPO|nr:hypothetical protein E4U09_002521 [Claviceps aff. purpurea]
MTAPGQDLVYADENADGSLSASTAHLLLKSQDSHKKAGSTTALPATRSCHRYGVASIMTQGGEEDLEMEVAGRLGSAHGNGDQKNAWFIRWLTCADCLNYKHIQEGREGHKGLHCPVPQLLDA